MLEKGATARSSGFVVERGCADGQLDGHAGRERRAHLGRGRARDSDDRDLDGLVDAERPGGNRPVDEDGADARRRELAHDLRRRRPGGEQRCRPRDPAVAVVVEERVERVALRHGDDLPARERGDRRRDDAGRGRCAAQRGLAGGEHPEPGPQEDVHGRAPLPRVGRGDAERRRHARGGGDAAVARAGGPVVAGGRHDERVERHRPRRGRRERRRRGTRRTARRHRRARSAPRRARHRPRSGRRPPRARRAPDPCGRTPTRRRPRRAASPRRGSGAPIAPGATPWIPAGPRTPTISPASSVPCRSGRPGCGRVLLRVGVAPGLEHVQAGQEAPLQERVARVDAGVEQRDRDAGAIDARERDLDPSSAPRREHVGLEDRTVLRHGRRVRRADGEHPLHRRVSLERGQEPGIEGRREPVQHAHVGLLGLDRDAAEGEPCDRPLLGVARGRRPGPHLDLARPAHLPRAPGRRATARGGRRSSGRRARGSGRLPRSPCHPSAPVGSSGVGAARPARREQPAGDERREREQRRGRPLRSTRTSTHRGQGSREM